MRSALLATLDFLQYRQASRHVFCVPRGVFQRQTLNPFATSAHLANLVLMLVLRYALPVLWESIQTIQVKLNVPCAKLEATLAPKVRVNVQNVVQDSLQPVKEKQGVKRVQSGSSHHISIPVHVMCANRDFFQVQMQATARLADLGSTSTHSGLASVSFVPRVNSTSSMHNRLVCNALSVISLPVKGQVGAHVARQATIKIKQAQQNARPVPQVTSV